MKMDSDTGKWQYIGSDKAKDKIGHALRKASQEKNGSKNTKKGSKRKLPSSPSSSGEDHPRGHPTSRVQTSPRLYPLQYYPAALIASPTENYQVSPFAQHRPEEAAQSPGEKAAAGYQLPPRADTGYHLHHPLQGYPSASHPATLEGGAGEAYLHASFRTGDPATAGALYSPHVHPGVGGGGGTRSAAGTLYQSPPQRTMFGGTSNTNVGSLATPKEFIALSDAHLSTPSDEDNDGAAVSATAVFPSSRGPSPLVGEQEINDDRNHPPQESSQASSISTAMPNPHHSYHPPLPPPMQHYQHHPSYPPPPPFYPPPYYHASGGAAPMMYPPPPPLPPPYYHYPPPPTHQLGHPPPYYPPPPTSGAIGQHPPHQHSSTTHCTRCARPRVMDHEHGI